MLSLKTQNLLPKIDHPFLINPPPPLPLPKIDPPFLTKPPPPSPPPKKMLYAPLPAPIRKIVEIYLLSRLAKGDKNYEIIADVKS